MPAKTKVTSGFHAHDHARCVDSAIKRAQNLCERDGLNLTQQRKRVLEILLETHRAMGAYDILERLHAEGAKSQPPVVYRALDFLVSNGLAHKIEQLNAFVACGHSDQEHRPAFMICNSCERVEETQILQTPRSLEKQARASGFTIEHTLIEARGLCPACSKVE